MIALSTIAAWPIASPATSAGPWPLLEPIGGATVLVGVGAARSGDLFGEVLPWLLALAALAIVGCGALLLLRRALRRDVPSEEAFTLESLRQLHRDGALSDEEFERARSSMLDNARVSAARHRAEVAAREAADRARRGKVQRVDADARLDDDLRRSGPSDVEQRSADGPDESPP